MATGQTLCRFTPQNNQPPAANYATYDVRNGLLVLDFDKNTDESAIFVDILPRNYGGGGLTVTIHWMSTANITGAVIWEASFERHQAGTDDSDSDSFAAARTVSSTAVGVGGSAGTEMVASIAFTDGAQMDNLAVGERFRLKISRDANGTNGTDDMDGDAELVCVEIKET